MQLVDRPRERRGPPGRARAHRARRARGRPRGRRGLAEDAQQVPRARRRARGRPAAGVDADETALASRFLRWLADDHFTFLGYREYTLQRDRRRRGHLAPCPAPASASCAPTSDSASDPDLLTPQACGQGPRGSSWCSPRPTPGPPCTASAYLDYVGVKTFDDERRGRRRAPLPRAVLSSRLHRVGDPDPGARARRRTRCSSAPGFDPRQPHRQGADGHPRDLPARRAVPDASVDELLPMAAMAVLQLPGAPPAAAVRPPRTTYGRFVSVPGLPAARPLQHQRPRADRRDPQGAAAAASRVEFTARVSESMLARLHFVVRPPKGGERIARRRRPTTSSAGSPRPPRSWRDDFAAAAARRVRRGGRRRLLAAYADAFPEAYKEDFTRRPGAVDLGRLEASSATARHSTVALYQPADAGPARRRLKVFRVGPPLSLSEVLPMLSLDGRRGRRRAALRARPGRRAASYIYDFGLRYAAGDAARGRAASCSRTPFARGLGRRRRESTASTRWCCAAGLTWRQATVLRAYAKYLRQGGTAVRAGLHRGRAARATSTSPARSSRCSRRASTRGRDGAGRRRRGARRAESSEIDEPDRRRPRRRGQPRPRPDPALLPRRSSGPTLRTNYFQPDADGRPQVLHLAQARARRRSPTCPSPRPQFEIFVYSPAGRGRAPALRRGRPRRPALVRPPRGLPHRGARPGQGADGEERRHRAGRRQGRLRLPSSCPTRRSTARRGWPRASPATRRSSPACSTSPTTSSTARSCRRSDVVRHDGDDPYLVVAADKGTATFSDIANGVAQDYGFWLGDAFASGGSVGYDHKAMGITARGAWESVKRHFRELGVDTQTEDFTVVGIGDMSGDVFGNGMLLSRAHPAGRRLRPPAHLPRPDPGRRRRRSPSASGCSTCRARRWARLRHGADLRGRRRLPAHR